MIDIHSHILPGIDDGPSDLGTALALARRYVAAGFSWVAATPHASAVQMAEGRARSVRVAVARFNQVLRRERIDLKVLPGMETEMDSRLPEFVRSGAAIALGDRKHLLVETPFLRIPLAWERLVFEVATAGVTVVFAHPERCEQIFKDRRIAHAMMDAGARLQVNWESFAGAYGRSARHLARWMAEERLIHCLATDSHDPMVRNPDRVPALRAELAEWMGEANLKRLSLMNPARALCGQAMRNMDQAVLTARPAKKSWWRRWCSA